MDVGVDDAVGVDNDGGVLVGCFSCAAGNDCAFGAAVTDGADSDDVDDGGGGARC